MLTSFMDCICISSFTWASFDFSNSFSRCFTWLLRTAVASSPDLKQTCPSSIEVTQSVPTELTPGESWATPPPCSAVPWPGPPIASCCSPPPTVCSAAWPALTPGSASQPAASHHHNLATEALAWKGMNIKCIILNGRWFECPLHTTYDQTHGRVGQRFFVKNMMHKRVISSLSPLNKDPLSVSTLWYLLSKSLNWLFKCW